MLLVLRMLVIAALGAGLGLGSAFLALDDPRLDFTPRIGPWHVEGAAADPYAAARAARDGTLALGAAEGVAFTAVADDEGRTLDPRCHYAVAGPVPPGELWTLAVTDRAGRPPVNPAGRIGFTSRDVIRRADGTVEIAVGPSMRPGNAVPAPGLASLRLTLRVYSPRLAADLPGREEMPAIRRLDCAGGRG
jgi:hypothetical protein